MSNSLMNESGVMVVGGGGGGGVSLASGLFPIQYACVLGPFPPLLPTCTYMAAVHRVESTCSPYCM